MRRGRLAVSAVMDDLRHRTGPQASASTLLRKTLIKRRHDWTQHGCIRAGGRDRVRLTVKMASNPYRAKKIWPPDFEKLSAKHQFRLERRYRRRAQLKWSRPGWTKAMKLAQWGGITCKLLDSDDHKANASARVKSCRFTESSSWTGVPKTPRSRACVTLGSGESKEPCLIIISGSEVVLEQSGLGMDDKQRRTYIQSGAESAI